METRNIPFGSQRPARFSSLLREIEHTNKQSLAIALKELEAVGLPNKAIISQKPLHTEYALTEKGHSLVPVFRHLEAVE